MEYTKSHLEVNRNIYFNTWTTTTFTEIQLQDQFKGLCFQGPPDKF